MRTIAEKSPYVEDYVKAVSEVKELTKLMERIQNCVDPSYTKITYRGPPGPEEAGLELLNVGGRRSKAKVPKPRTNASKPRK